MQKTFNRYLYSKITIIFIGLMLLIALLKTFAAVQADPLIAYSNNTDFSREMGCLGIWNNYPGMVDKALGYWNNPVNNLTYTGEKVDGWCTFSSDNSFGYAVRIFFEIGDRIDFRLFGAAKVLFLLIMISINFIMLKQKQNTVAVAAASLLVIGDITYLSYFNTFYSDFSSVMGALLCALALLNLLERASWPRVALALIAVLLLGWSKQQYTPFAVLCLIYWAWLTWSRSRLMTASLILAAIAIPLTFTFINPTDSGVRKSAANANSFDTFLGAVIPASRDPQRSLALVSLPSSCAIGLGHLWYDEGFGNDAVCPEVYQLPRTALLKLFVDDPHTLVVPLIEGVTRMRPFLVANLHNAGSDGVRNGVRYRFIKATSITTLLDLVPLPVFFSILIASISAGAVCLIAHLTLHRNASLLALSAFGGLLVGYTLVSCVFGDGYMELSKHGATVGVGLSLQAAALIAYVCKLFEPSVSDDIAAV